jgi:uncharacterized protein (DUF362 family)/NAD-dependent dihydropyrimidine dehydrogenase PreA subunit
MSVVAIIKCYSYDYSQVYESVQRGFNLLGGIERFALPLERILLKPNLLTGADPNRCITTHPSVFKAVAELFKTTGAIISYGDNPGIISPFSAAKKAGISKVADMLKIGFADFKTVKEIHFEDGKQNKVFHIVKGVFDNDGIISLPKFKTHGLTKISGCVKNQYGCLPFIEKRLFHAKLSNANHFAKMLLDLNQCIHPRLYILDSIFAMEGDGPISGNPVKLNILALSSDPIALDATMCKIVNLDPAIVPTVFYGHQFGYGEYEDHKIELVGDDINQLINKDFKVDRKRTRIHLKRNISGNIVNSLAKKPVIIQINCKKCGNCILVCPVYPKAIKFKDQFRNTAPEIDYAKCIRCYCCHELCPEKAIKLKTPVIMKFKLAMEKMVAGFSSCFDYIKQK